MELPKKDYTSEQKRLVEELHPFLVTFNKITSDATVWYDCGSKIKGTVITEPGKLTPGITKATAD